MNSDLKRYGLNSLILYNCLKNNNISSYNNKANRSIDIAFTGGEYTWKGYSFFKSLSQVCSLIIVIIKLMLTLSGGDNTKNYKSFKRFQPII